MLTRAQIQRLAQRNRIGMQVQERDYLQHVLLSLLYARSQALTFKGGTALRLVYRGNRYSEGLDFNGPDDVEGLRRLWGEVVADLKNFGVLAQMRNDWESAMGYSFGVSYAGPLYDGRDHSKGKVRVDVSRRMEKVEIQRELISSEYDDVRPFVITVLTSEHMLAEKVRALLTRGKPRDLYDIWLLLNQGVSPDRSLIERKLELYGIAFSPQALEEALARVQTDWERDLRPLLPQFVAYQDVVDVTQRLIEHYKLSGD
jgi:predicted nucleotidyltransferase component of viral defense system